MDTLEQLIKIIQPLRHLNDEWSQKWLFKKLIMGKKTLLQAISRNPKFDIHVCSGFGQRTA